jgi:hypothetical protein
MLTRSQVAKRLGKSIATVRRMEGTVLHPRRDAGGVLRFDPVEVDRVAGHSRRAGRRPSLGEIARSEWFDEATGVDADTEDDDDPEECAHRERLRRRDEENRAYDEQQRREREERARRQDEMLLSTVLDPGAAGGVALVPRLTVWERTADGLVERSEVGRYPGLVLPMPFTFARVDGDASVDIVSYEQGTPVGYLNDGAFHFKRTLLGETATEWQDKLVGLVEYADRNHDGSPDLLVLGVRPSMFTRSCCWETERASSASPVPRRKSSRRSSGTAPTAPDSGSRT